MSWRFYRLCPVDSHTCTKRECLSEGVPMEEAHCPHKEKLDPPAAKAPGGRPKYNFEIC
jgi:hypothetical protein